MLRFIFLILVLFNFSIKNFATTHTINAGNLYFIPSSLTIYSGDTVQWINDGGWHDVNFDINSQTGISFGNPEAFQSTATGNGIIHTHVFTIPGIYNYDCSVGAGSHASAGIVGVIEVQPSLTNQINAIFTEDFDGGMGHFTIYTDPGSPVNWEHTTVGMVGACKLLQHYNLQQLEMGG